MKNHIIVFLLGTLALVTAGQSNASTVDVTNASQVTLNQGDSLIFYLSTDYANCNHGYPAGIEMILGSMPLGGPVASIPGTSGVYMQGILFNGTLASPTGGNSLALTDANAARLGLPDGDMLMTPGARTGGTYSGTIDLLSANVSLGSLSAGLLGSGEVAIELENAGAPVTFGYSGSPMASDLTASWVSADGSQSTGARILDVQCINHGSNAPEPGTVGLFIIGLTVMASRLWRARSRRARAVE
jgi:hypothetical protein